MPKEDQQSELIATPDDYATIFSDNKVGQKIYEDLMKRFGAMRSKSTGIDRVLDQQEYWGARKILEFITLRINQANGVQDDGSSNE